MWTLYIVTDSGREIPHWTDDAYGVVREARALLRTNPKTRYVFRKA